MITKSDNELHNLWVGDTLTCRSCGFLIIRMVPGFFRFQEIADSYRWHAQSCFGLRRLIVEAEQQPKPLPPPKPIKQPKPKPDEPRKPAKRTLADFIY